MTTTDERVELRAPPALGYLHRGFVTLALDDGRHLRVNALRAADAFEVHGETPQLRAALARLDDVIAG